MSRKTGRVTLEDVAKATGFTINTVSRALKNKEDISRETCLRIQKVAREMGYVRNYIASSLRSGRTKTIALISGTLTNQFYVVLADLLQREAFRLGYSLMILCSQDDPEMELSTVEMAVSRQADGVLIIPWSDSSPALTLLRESGIPFVLLNRSVGGGRDDCILCEEEQGGYLAGEHLIREGHRKLAMITTQDVIFATESRLKGFRRACAEAGIPEEDCRFAVVNSDEEITRQLLAWKEQGITGLFSFCDSEAWREITLMESAGLRVPEDFAIVGFDNIQEYIRIAKPICSVDSDFRKEAVAAIDMLRNRIHNPSLPPQRVVLPVSLVCRHSCTK